MDYADIGSWIIFVLIIFAVLNGFNLQRISSDLRKIVKFIEERESETKKTTSPIFQNIYDSIASGIGLTEAMERQGEQQALETQRF